MRNPPPVLTLAIVVAIAVVCLLVLIASQGPTEPNYKGLTMIEWLSGPETPAQEEAILILGTNNLPLLVQRMNYDPTTDRAFTVYSRLPARLKNVKFLSRLGLKNSTKAVVAGIVMHRLGPRAAPSVPALGQLALNTSQPVALRALFVLGQMGEPAVTGIVVGTYNADPKIRNMALFNLVRYKHSPPAWQAITNAINDTDPKISQFAADIANGTIQ